MAHTRQCAAEEAVRRPGSRARRRPPSSFRRFFLAAAAAFCAACGGGGAGEPATGSAGGLLEGRPGAVLSADPTDPAVALADSLLPRLEVLSGLRATGPLRLARRTRAELRSYVAEQLAEELPPARATALRDLYALLGVVPDTLDLGRLLLELYTEQVAGYYDPEADTLFLVEGMPADQVEGILAHELVHALQDQHAPLDSLIHADRGNDRRTAAQAALEGHATMVMLALAAERLTGRALDRSRLPDPADALAGAMEAQSANFPVFGAAPAFIRHSLLFPYIHGAAFVRRLWLAGGAEPQWAAPLGTRLPHSTEQVLHPAEAFLEGRDAPTELRVVPPTGWRVRYEDTLGEFETGRVLVEAGAGTEAAARGWHGDRLLLLDGPDGSAALWYSLWDDAAAAERFAAAAERLVGARPGIHGRAQRGEVEGLPGVLVLLAREGVVLESLAAPVVEVMGGG